MLKIIRKTIYIGPYKGFYTDENIFNPFLGNYSHTDIWLSILGIKIKKLYTYRVSGKRFYKGKV